MDAQKEDIILTFAKYGIKFEDEYKDEKKLISAIFQIPAIIAIGDYVIKYDKLPDYDISNINININSFYTLLHCAKYLYKNKNNKIYNDIDEIIKYLDSIIHIIKPECDAFESKKEI